ncbi:MAG: biopolymer transporter ExbD [Bdellovibrionales bacterium]|nr:biopolymer transporter ExbD [Bdellovibrionales bacterium]
MISLLAVLICMLLLTTVWVNIGTLDIAQAFGGQTQVERSLQPTLWIEIRESGRVSLRLKDVAKANQSLRQKNFRGVDGQPNWNSISQHIANVTRRITGLKTALILPSANTEYDSVIHLIDQLKATGITDVGIAPL